MTRRIGRLPTAAALAIAALLALLEALAGRPPLCLCGRVALWTGTVRGPENSQQIADWYSPSHLIHGLLFYAALHLVARRLSVGTRLVIAVAIEAGWELLENSPIIIDRYRAATLAVGYSGDSILNSVSDVGFMALGFAIASRLRAGWSVALGVALELLALAAIRDNLTLNIVMLVHPIEAVRVWQGG